MTIATAPAAKVKKPRTKYHGAARSLYKYFFADYIKRGIIELEAEYELSGGPRKIDILLLKKKRDVEIDTLIGRIYRGHNIVEFKSPVDDVITLQDFVKTVHVYAGGYAFKNDVMLTDITVSIVTYKKPSVLFETLEKIFNYKIKRGASGIYYIELKGVPVEKTLRIQVVVCPELSDEYWELDALSRELRPEELPKFSELVKSKEGSELYGSDWGDTVTNKSKEILKREEQMVSKKVRREIATAWGFVEENKVQELAQKRWQKGRQEGMKEGMKSVLSLLERGVPLAEVKRELQLA